MSRPGSAGSNQRAASAASDASLDLELPVLFPAIFGLQRERSVVGDPWQVDNQAIRQLSGAAKRGNLPRLTSTHSSLSLADGKRSSSQQTRTLMSPKLESLSRNSRTREMHIHLPNDYPVLPSISPDRASPDGYIDRYDSDLVSLPLSGQNDSLGRSHSPGSNGISDSLAPREITFGSSISLNSRGSTLHSSPEMTFIGNERSDTASVATSGPVVRIVSAEKRISCGDAVEVVDNMKVPSQATSPAGSRPTSPRPPSRPKSRTTTRRRQQELEKSAKQKQEQVMRALQGGCPGTVPEPPSRQVRLYLSSTGTDMVDEWKHLKELAFPKLAEICQEFDLDLAIIDLETDRLLDEEEEHFDLQCLRLQEISKCYKSAGPSFAVFIGDRRGPLLLPASISQQDFNVLKAVLERENPEDALLLTVCYRKNENCVPPVYLLQKPIDMPLSPSGENSTWPETKERLVTLIASGAEIAHAQEMITEDCYRKFHMSALELEVHHGILKNKDTRKRSLAYLRSFEGLTDDLDNIEAAKYIDLQGIGARNKRDKDTVSVLRDLKEQTIPEVVSENNRHTYSAWWQVKGLEPEHCQHNANYLKLLCRHFVTDTKRIINQGVKNNNSWMIFSRELLKVYEEVIQHLEFARQLCRDYVDWCDNLSKLKKMLVSEGRSPFNIHGEPGCGKSALIAKVSNDIKTVMDKECICVTRFMQIYSQRRSLQSLLHSLCIQICTVYKIQIPIGLKHEDAFTLAMYFQDLLFSVSQIITKDSLRTDLIIILDSLDLLKEDGNYTWWLPQKCPEGVYILVSLGSKHIPDPINGSYCTFIVAMPTKVESIDLTNALIAKVGHTLTQGQTDLLTKVISEAEDLSPLNVTLMAKELLNWKSYQDTKDLHVKLVVKDLVSGRLQEAENRFGSSLVTDVCGYILTASGGISETELVNVLAQNDMLRDEYKITTYLQSLTLIRLRESMKNFLCETRKGGQTYISWSHNTLEEIIRERYPKNLHSSLARMYIEQIQTAANKVISRELENTDRKRPVTVPNSLARSFDVMPFHFSNCDIDFGEAKKSFYYDVEILSLRIWLSSIDALIQDTKQIQTNDEGLHELFMLLNSYRQNLVYEQVETFETIRLQLAALVIGHPSKGNTELSNLQNIFQQAKSILQNSPNVHLAPVFPYHRHHHEDHYLHMMADSITLHPLTKGVLMVTIDTASGVSITDLHSMVPIRQDALLSQEDPNDQEQPRLVISQDGCHVVILETGMVTLQHLRSGTILHQLNLDDDGDKPCVKTLLVTSDCSTIVMITGEGTLVTIDFDTGQVVRRFPLTGNGEKEEAMLANCSNEQNKYDVERTSSVASASKIELTTEDTTGVSDVDVIDIQFSPDFSTLAMTEHDNSWSVLLWDIHQWTITRKLSLPSEACTKAVFSPNSSIFLIGVVSTDHVIANTMDGTIKHTLNGDSLCVDQPSPQPCQPCFSSTGQLVIVRTGEHKVGLFSVETGDRKQDFQTSSLCVALLFSNDDTFVYGGDLNGTIIMWDVICGSSLWIIDCGGLIQTLYLHDTNSEQYLYSVTSAGYLDAWCLTNVTRKIRAERLKVIPNMDAKLHDLRCLNKMHRKMNDPTYEVSPNIIGSYPRDSLETIYSKNMGGKTVLNSPTEISTSVFHDIQISPDGRFVISANRQLGVQVWDITTGNHVTTIECHDVWKVLIANDGCTLVCTTYTRQLMLYTLERDKWQLVDRLRNISHLAQDSVCVSADTRTLVVTKLADVPPDHINIYIIDLVTCHIMAHLLMRVEIKASQIGGMEITLSHDNTRLLICLTPVDSPSYPLIVCDLYKEISMELPSWARNSPSPLPSARSRTVTPLGINIEEFGESYSSQNLGRSYRRSSLVSHLNSSLLSVPNQPSELLDHTYPVKDQKGNINQLDLKDESSANTYDGIVINVFEDESEGADDEKGIQQPKEGLLGVGLYARVQGDSSDAGAMLSLKNTNSSQPTSDRQNGIQEKAGQNVLHADSSTDAQDQYNSKEISAKQREIITASVSENGSKDEETNLKSKNDNEKQEADKDDDQTDARSEGTDEALDVKELQEALTKCLQRTNSTELDPSGDMADPHLLNGTKDIQAGTGSLRGHRQNLENNPNVVHNRQPGEVALHVIMETGEEEDQLELQNSNLRETVTDSVLTQQETLNTQDDDSADDDIKRENVDCERDNTVANTSTTVQEETQGKVGKAGDNLDKTTSAAAPEQEPSPRMPHNALPHEPNADDFDDDPLYKSSFSEVNLSLSQGKFRRIKKMDSLSAIVMSHPVRSPSQLSFSLPFDFDQAPPEDNENPTGRRCEVGHVSRTCHVLLQNPDLTTLALEGTRLFIGTKGGNLLVLDMASTIVTKVLSTEVLSDDEVKEAIHLETADVGSGKVFTKRPHEGEITHVSRSQNFNYTVAASADKTLSLWNMSETSFHCRLDGHLDKVRWGEISGDNKMVVSGSDDNTVRLWDLQAGTAIFVLNTNGPVLQTKFSFGDLHVVARLGMPGLSRVAIMKVHRPLSSEAKSS